MGIGIGNLLIMIIHMLVNKEYQFKKYTPIMHISYLVIAAIMYYVIEWLKNYDKYLIIYWVALTATIILDIIIFVIINLLKKDDDKPKFKVNK